MIDQGLARLGLGCREVEDAQAEIGRQGDVLRLADVEALAAQGIQARLTRCRHRREALRLALRVDDPPLDVVHGHRVGREEQPVVLPDKLGILPKRTLLEHSHDPVHDLEDTALAEDRVLISDYYGSRRRQLEFPPRRGGFPWRFSPRGRITMGVITDRQVRILRHWLKAGKPLKAAAMRANMDEKTARKYRAAAKLPSELQVWPRTWRTREDPFAAVWDEV